MKTRNRNRSVRVSKARGLRLESLEFRRLLAGDTTILVADEFTVRQNSGPGEMDVLANDLFADDYPGARQITAVSFGSEGGRIEIGPDHTSLVYAPPADFSGTETFSYFVDGQLLTTVSVEITSPLRPDNFRIPPDGQPHRLNLLANDPFWAGYEGPRKISLVSVTSGLGEVEIADDGNAAIYRPDPLSAGQEQFVYIVDERYAARVTIEIPETLRADDFEILQNASDERLTVLANDPFWTGYAGAKQITYVSPSRSESGAAITIAGDGRALVYSPAADFTGYDSFWYAVDGRFEANVSVYVVKPAQDDYFEIDTNSTDHPLQVTGNDQYWSVRRQTYVDVVQRVTSVEPTEAGGTVSIGPDGQSIAYTPPADFSGTDTFTYRADGRYPARVTVQVTRPVRNDYLSVFQDTPAQRLPVLQNDFVGNGYTGPKQLSGLSESQQGAQLQLDGSAVRYTPPAGYTGGDYFTYVVDGELEAEVRLSVVPLAQSDYYYFCSTGVSSYSLNVLANDHFRAGYLGPGRITSAAVQGEEGEVTITSDGQSLQYRPGSQTWDQITYTVDGKYTAEVSVSRQNHLAYDQFVVDQNADATTLDVLANDFDIRYGDCPSSRYTGLRRITGVSGSDEGGTVIVSSDGKTVLYEPPTDFYGMDRFTYIVDGTMEVTSSVSVVRRVRDDQVRVAPGEADSLAVLVNDLFGADYQGAQQITDVTASRLGATVSISADGRSLSYSAPADVAGHDTLTYTVDGKLKAEVDVIVQADGTSLFPQFESSAEFEQFLIDDAVSRYEGLFGQPAYSYFPYPQEADFEFGAPIADDGSRDHSETNVQVAGIDEADIVEFDADYVYQLTGNDLVILDAWPATELHEVGRADIDGNAVGMYLSGDRLTVISERVKFEIPPLVAEPWLDGPLLGIPDVAGDIARPGFWLPYTPPTYETIVTVFDVSDRHVPALVQQSTLEGRYVQSRGISDYVYVAVSNQAVPPPPRVIPDEGAESDVFRGGTYETKEAYLERVRANLGEFIDETLPNYSSVGADGELTRAGLLHEPEDIYRPLTEGASALVSLVSINTQNSEPGLSGSSGVYTNGGTQVYASLEHFYVFENGYEPEDGSVTRVLQFDWNGDTGAVEFAAAGQVAGWMLNQFSADEYEGHLRIVTTISHSGSGNWTGTSENDLFVLRDDGGVLEFVGSLQNLALGESTQSVRFMGPQAFLVTFRNVDPLFGLDVSDPAAPQALGHLTLPGFASYMQMIAPNRLLTVGRNTPNGFAGPAQVSLFDVSDLTQPRLIDEFTFDRFSQSEAAVDHHAFGYFARHGILAVPSARSFVMRTDEDQDGYAETRTWVTENELMVFRIDVDAAPGTMQGIDWVGEIAHDSPVRRSGYIDDMLFSIAENSVHVMSVDDPNTILASATDLRQVDPEETPVDPPPAIPGDLFRSAQQDLAERLSVAAGAVMPVVLERDQGAWKTVVRVADQYYQYTSTGNESHLSVVGFEFAAPGTPVSWQNPLNAWDVNRDGEVAPNDAILIINQLTTRGPHTLPTETVVRQISDSADSELPYFDTSGDGNVSALDALLVINRLNELTSVNLDAGPLDANNPSSLEDTAAVDDFFARVLQTAGDANLDGTFDSADLVQVLQRGRFEDASGANASWAEGDWDGDRRFTTADLVLALTYGHYTPGSKKGE